MVSVSRSARRAARSRARGRALLLALSAVGGCARDAGETGTKRTAYLVILAACGITLGFLALLGVFGRAESEEDEGDDATP
jgi:hypothetical protein